MIIGSLNQLSLTLEIMNKEKRRRGGKARTGLDLRSLIIAEINDLD